MSNEGNKENDALCQDDSNKLKGETATPRPTFRRSVLRAFDPFYESPGVNKIKTLIADEEELFEDAQTSLPTISNKFSNKDTLLIPGLNGERCLNDTEELSFAECVESPSQINKTRCYNVSTSEDEVEFNYRNNLPLSKSTIQDESINQIELISEEKQLNKTFEEASGGHQIVFVDIQLNTTMEGTVHTVGDLDPLNIDNQELLAQSLNEDVSIGTFENEEDLSKVEKLHGTGLQEDVEFISQSFTVQRETEDPISNSKVDTAPTYQDVDNIVSGLEPMNIQEDVLGCGNEEVNTTLSIHENTHNHIEAAQEISEVENKEGNLDGTLENESFTVKKQDTFAARDNESLVLKSEVNCASTLISTDLKIEPEDVPQAEILNGTYTQEDLPPNESISLNIHSDLDPVKVEQQICLSGNEEDSPKVAILDRTHPRNEVELIEPKNDPILDSKVDTTPNCEDIGNVGSGLEPTNIQQHILGSGNEEVEKLNEHKVPSSSVNQNTENEEAVNLDGTAENVSFTVKKQDTNAAPHNKKLVSESEVNSASTHQHIDAISTNLNIEPEITPQAEILNGTYSQEDLLPNESITPNTHSDLDPVKVEHQIYLSGNEEDTPKVGILDRTHPRNEPKNESFLVEQKSTYTAQDDKDAILNSRVDTVPVYQDVDYGLESTNIRQDILGSGNEEVPSSSVNQNTDSFDNHIDTSQAVQEMTKAETMEIVNLDGTHQDIDRRLPPEDVPQAEILNKTYSQEDLPPNESISPKTHNVSDPLKLEQQSGNEEQLGKVAILNRTHPRNDAELIEPKNESFTVEQDSTYAAQDDKNPILNPNLDTTLTQLDPDNSQSENDVDVPKVEKLDSTYSQNDVKSNNKSFTIEQHNNGAGQGSKKSKDDTAPTHLDSDLKPLESEEVTSQLPKVDKLNETYLREDLDSNHRSFIVERQHSNAPRLDKNPILDLEDVANADEQVEIPFEANVHEAGPSNVVDIKTGTDNYLNRTSETSTNEYKPLASLNIADPHNAIEDLAKSLNQTIDVEESAIVDDLNVSNGSNDDLNEALELVEENVDDVPKNLEAVIKENNLPVTAAKSAETPSDVDVGMEKILDEKKTERDGLKSKLDDVTSELAKLQEENTRCDQQILAEALARQAELNKIKSYKKMVDLYEQEVAKQNETLFSLRGEAESDRVRLASTEMAFSALFNKYEKTKPIIEECVKNETILKANIEQIERLLAKSAAKYEKMQERREQNLKRMKEEVALEQEAYLHEIAKLKALAKKIEIKIGTLENAIKQKTEEAAALSQLCDEMTGRPPT